MTVYCKQQHVPIQLNVNPNHTKSASARKATLRPRTDTRVSLQRGLAIHGNYLPVSEQQAQHQRPDRCAEHQHVADKRWARTCPHQLHRAQRMVMLQL